MTQPLLSRWRIAAASLPEDLLDFAPRAGFSLPGASALLDFSDLLGEEPGSPAAPPADLETEDAAQEAPFPLPAMIPQEISGEVSLLCEVDFGAVEGDRAVLVFDQLAGSGDILIGGKAVLSFSAGIHNDPGGLCCAYSLDVTDALHSGRKETICIRFDGARPAGVPGPVFLRTSRFAHIASLILSPSALQRSVTAIAHIAAGEAGDYVLRLQASPPHPGETPEAARETRFSLRAGEKHDAGFSMSMPGGVFIPGQRYMPPVVRAELLRRCPGKKSERLVPCDSMTLLCGYPGKTPPFHVPLTRTSCAQDIQALAKRLCDLHISCVGLDFPAADAFYREMTHAGVAVRQWLPQDHPSVPFLRRYPCVAPDFSPAPCDPFAPPPEVSAWQLCGVCGMDRTADPDMTPADLLYDAAGGAVDPSDPHVRAVLMRLRPLLIRLRAEAARQGRFSGALCAPGEWESPDVADALRAALRPVHLSALPLLGAWWTGTRFSASLEACIPGGEGWHSLHARAVLLDENGEEWSRFFAPVSPMGGYVGLMECPLPPDPCVLSLHVRLTQGVNEILIEEYTLPVYVGGRGPLEAAF